MRKALLQAVATIHELRIRGNRAQNALWRAVDAFHKHDTPREFPFEDAKVFMSEAAGEELEREEKKLNDTGYPGKDIILAGLVD